MRYSLLLVFFLIGCSVTGEVRDAQGIDSEKDQAFYGSWLVSGRDQVAIQVTQNLKRNLTEFAPETLSSLPRARLSVSLVNNTLYPNRSAIEKALEHIFQKVWNEVFASPSATDEVDARISVTFFNPRLSTTAGSAIAIPNAAVCFSSLFIVCPTKSTQIVRLEMEFLSKNRVVFVRGIGGAYKLLSTGVVEDNDEIAEELATERGIKALTAAIADTVKNAKAQGYGTRSR